MLPEMCYTHQGCCNLLHKAELNSTLCNAVRNEKIVLQTLLHLAILPAYFNATPLPGLAKY